MSGRLDGKVAIITGAARGQGEAEARLFAAEGAKVVLTDLLEEQGEAVAADIGDAALFVRHDITDEAGWADVVARTTERFGPPTVLVNNAGILRFNRFQHEDVDSFRKVLEVNLVGVFLGMHAVIEPMREAGGGSIVNISSIAGIVGTPGTSAYSTSKFGVTGMTKSAAIDLGPYGIRVNSVHPGSIDTPMIRDIGGIELPIDAFDAFVNRLPIKRLGTPADIAPMVVFLASDESGYCTGAEFVIDGGETCGDLGLM